MVENNGGEESTFEAVADFVFTTRDEETRGETWRSSFAEKE